MNFKHLDDETLHKNTKQLAQAERKGLVILLRHLHENERRRLFSKYKCESLHKYVVDHLKYPDDDAQRRIAAMRLMRAMPEIVEHIEDGSLNLTNICLVQVLFKKEKKAGRMLMLEQKREVVGRLLGKSTRQAAKIVAEINPDMKKTKILTYALIENDALRDRLLQVRGRFAHIEPDMELEDLLFKLCDIADEADRKTAAPRFSKRGSEAAAGSHKEPVAESEAEIYRKVRIAGGNKCTRCGSTHAVQVDHIIPVAAGGKTTYDNLRLLCKNCNLRAAIEYFGQEKMDSYLSDVIRPYGIGPRRGVHAIEPQPKDCRRPLYFNRPRSRNGFRARPKLAAIIECENPLSSHSS